MKCETENFQKDFMFDNLYAGMRLQQSCNGQNVFLFFYGKKTFLSNAYPSPFVVDGISFRCAEQALQYFKAKTLNANDAAVQILLMVDSTEMSKAGQELLSGDRNKENKDKWFNEGADILRKVLKAKFSQNERLLRMLQCTRPCSLIYANPYDNFFGIGCSMANSKIDCFHNWRGENVMGKILEDIREQR